MEGEDMRTVIEEAIRKLEEKYCVRISPEATTFTLDQIKRPLYSEEISGKAVEILDGACKLVIEKFRSCAFLKEFSEKAYELHRALVEINELYRDNHPDSQSWLTRLKMERDRASLYIKEFLREWDHVLMLSGESGLLTPECAEHLSTLKEVTTLTPGGVRDIRRFLDDIQSQLIGSFLRLLTVELSHVAEVVSSLTDVPLTQIHRDNTNLREMAICKAKLRVVNQEHVLDAIFKTLSCERETTVRPRGLFLLLGPSGVGKTEIAKAIAEHWYSDLSRLVEIDMLEYADPQWESESCELSEWSKRKQHDLWNRLTGVVRKRPYSVILFDKIEKASSSVEEVLLGVLSNDAPKDIEGNHVDFSKSIIFMTSCVGPDQPALARKFIDPMTELRVYRNSIEKGSGSKTVVIEAIKFFGTNLLASFDEIIVLEKLPDLKAVARLLLRELVNGVPEERFTVHVTDTALHVLLAKALNPSDGDGKAIKRSLRMNIIPMLPTVKAYNNPVVYVDTLVGTWSPSFRIEAHKKSMDDFHFKQKDGTFGKKIANLRMKVKSVCSIFDLQRECLPLLHRSDQNLTQLGAIYESILTFTPILNEPPNYAFEEKASSFPMDEEKEKFANICIELQKRDSAVTEAIRFIVDAFRKTIDPLLPELLVRHYLLLGLDDIIRKRLIDGLTESLRVASGKSLFKYVNLKQTNLRGKVLREWLIYLVKKQPCRVLLLDGVEYADDVLYKSLLEIFDYGTLEDDNGEGFSVDFRKTIVILASETATKRGIWKCLKCDHKILRNMAVDLDVKRFRTELLMRVDEFIIFHPLAPKNGRIVRIRRSAMHNKNWKDCSRVFKFLFELFQP